jgi:nicotinamide-nucleotide amidase
MRYDESALERLAAALGDELRQTGRILATAESCTGGWIAKLMTDVAGSSAWFDRGFVTYSNRAKQEMLGISTELLSAQGAVSEAVVREMAQAALARSDAHITVAVSGIAGPGGGSDEKPVGTVWFAWSVLDGPTRSEHQLFSGDREAVRRAAAAYALEGVRRVLVNE